jgi:hypothetical protein
MKISWIVLASRVAHGLISVVFVFCIAAIYLALANTLRHASSWSSKSSARSRVLLASPPGTTVMRPFP